MHWALSKWRIEIMKESVTYQEILLEGKAEAANQIALNMLWSGTFPNLITQFTGLSLNQIQKLQPFWLAVMSDH